MSKKKEAPSDEAMPSRLERQVVQEVGIDFLSIEPDDLDLFQCRQETQRLQRTINILIAADFCTRQNAEQAYEIAAWK